MKIAASDYDGTLFRRDKIEKTDAAAVAKWRAAGHKFGVVTGRDYGMLTPQLAHYGVGYDYAVCNNGGIICRADGTALWQGKIANELLAKLIKETGVRKSFHFAFSAVDRTYLCHEFEGSWIKREGKMWDFPIIKIEEKDVKDLPQIHQLSLGFTTPEESREVAAVLNEKYGDKIHAFPNRCSLDITPNGIGKDQGIKKLIELMDWQDAEIYAIGDEINDLPMIKAFGGFTVDTARDAIQKEARKIYNSVGDMLIDNI